MNIKRRMTVLTKDTRIKKLFAIVSLMTVLGSSLPPAIAHAGLLQWLGAQSGNTGMLTGSANYAASITMALASPEDSGNAGDSAFIGENAVTEKHSPITAKTVRQVRSQRYVVEASGYSSTPDQTDDTPFITASGTYVRDGVIAANFLPIGTVIRIPNLYGDKTFIVEDRMNKRYWMNVDLWFASREAALQFGRRKIVIEVVS